MLLLVHGLAAGSHRPGGVRRLPCPGSTKGGVQVPPLLGCCQARPDTTRGRG